MFGPSDQGLSIRFPQYRNKVISQFQDIFISIGGHPYSRYTFQYLSIIIDHYRHHPSPYLQKIISLKM